MATFRAKRMNEWVGAVDAWLSQDAWKKCGGKVDREALRGLPCCGGLDLAKTSDMTALVLSFPDPGGGPRFTLLPFFFLPEGEIDDKERRAGLPKGTYADWAKRGYLTLTPGFTCDYNYIKQKLRDLSEEFDLSDVAYDKYNASQLANDMEDEGLTMEVFSQAIVNMNEPAVEFERLMMNGELLHGDNPIANWHIGNVTVRRNENGLIAPIKAGGPDGKDRGKSRNKIDFVVGAIMATARAGTLAGGRSCYEDEGVMVV